MTKTTTPAQPVNLLQARLNQPRVSLEYLRLQMERHRQASEEFFKAAKNETSKLGRENEKSGAIA